MSVREIAPECTDIPAGWPRPYYRDEKGKPRYAQWSGGRAKDQINNCSNDKTWVAAKNHLCSSCGAQMAQGLILDAAWLKSFMATHPDQFDRAARNGTHVHIGSPICFRCAVFARLHCPYFAGLHDRTGDQFRWIVTSSSQHYREANEEGIVEVVNPNSRPRITTAEVRNALHHGETNLTGLTAADMPDTARPETIYPEFSVPRDWDPAPEMRPPAHA